MTIAYDRSGLIERSIDTLKHALIEEAITVSLVIMLFLLHFRSSLLPILSLPISVALSFIPMVLLDIPSTIMSLGGIAIAIGATVDAEIVMIEASHKKLEHAGPGADRHRLLAEAAREVTPAIFFSLLIIAVAFLPVFTLTGQAGRLFKPLAYTKTFVMLISAAPVDHVRARAARPPHPRQDQAREEAPGLAVPHPALRAVRLRRAPPPEVDDRDRPLRARLGRAARPASSGTSSCRRSTRATCSTCPSPSPTSRSRRRSGSSSSRTASCARSPRSTASSARWARRDAHRSGAHHDGRDHRAAEARTRSGGRCTARWYSRVGWAPPWLARCCAGIWPEEQPLTWDELTAEMNGKMQFPGWTNAWTMPIKTRVDMLTTGVRTPIGIKVFGTDLARSRRSASRSSTSSRRSGTRSVLYERNLGGLYLDIIPKPDELARYGLRVADVERVIESAIGGTPIGTTIEGRNRFSINVRYPQDLRSDVEAIKRILVPLPRGGGAGAATLSLEWVTERTCSLLSVVPGCREQHRRRGLVGLAGEDVLLRDGEAHDRRVHPVHRLQRLGQFPLQGALVGDVLLEVGRGDALLVQQRPAVRARSGRQALAGQRDSLGVDLRLRHQHGGAAVGQLVLDAVRVQLGDHGVGVGAGQIAVERRPGRRGDPAADHERAHQQGEDRHDHDAALTRREAGRETLCLPKGLVQPRGHSGILMMSLNDSRALFLNVVVSSVAVCAWLAAIT